VRRSIGWNLVLLILVFLFSLAATAASDPRLSRLDPTLRGFVFSELDDVVIKGLEFEAAFDTSRLRVTASFVTGEREIEVLAKLRDPNTGDRIAGIPVVNKAGPIYTLSATAAELMSLAADPDIVYIEPAWRTQTQLDASGPAIGADLVHAGVSPVNGDGVLIGIVDTGIDYEHLDFRVDRDGDGTEESSRIVAIWDQTRGLFGATYAREQIEADLAAGYGPGEGEVYQLDADGHGTHVASIAAGDGSSSVNGFVGVAPAAELVVVKTSFFTSDILAGVEYVFEQADALGVPAVVNLSLGGHDGPHDGTSLFEEGLDALAQGPGRIIVVSAGNEGDEFIHTSSTLGGDSAAFDFVPTDWEVEISVWYPGTSQFDITIVPPSESPMVVPTGANTGHVPTLDGIVYVDNAAGGPNPNNGDHQAAIRVSSVTAGERWRIVVTDQGGGGRFDAWVTSQTADIVGGDGLTTIAEPGNADRVITVGSFNSKGTWPSAAGMQNYLTDYPLGAISSFSSSGPTRDGRLKPEITAPGAWICAAHSTSATAFSYLMNPDGLHAMELGTSMSAPHASGAVALLLSIDESMTVADVRDVLTSTATADAFTGSTPSPRWGWGKLNVADAVAAVRSAEPPPVDPPADPPAPEVGVAANPVATEAVFEYALPEDTQSAELRVYNVAGQRVFAAPLAVGSVTLSWNLEDLQGSPLASGLYLYVVVTDRGSSEVGKLVITR